MRKLLLILASAAVISGCGGEALLPGIGSPYEGSWAGTWVGTGFEGPLSFTVSIIGDLNGTMHSDSSGEDGTLSGVILDNGDTTLTWSFPSESPLLGTGVLTMNAELTTLSGTLDIGGEDVSFALTKN